jgi:hypothetical protein
VRALAATVATVLVDHRATSCIDVDIEAFHNHIVARKQASFERDPVWHPEKAAANSRLLKRLELSRKVSQLDKDFAIEPESDGVFEDLELRARPVGLIHTNKPISFSCPKS